MKKLLNLIFFAFIVFIFTSKLFASEEKIKIGLLLPLIGQNQEIGKSVLRSVNLAINKIDDPILEIYPKNNFDNPDDNIKAVQELYNQGIRIFIGPIFDKNIKNLEMPGRGYKKNNLINISIKVFIYFISIFFHLFYKFI